MSAAGKSDKKATFSIDVNSSTDYDLYATFSPELRDFLIANDFDNITNHDLHINNRIAPGKYTSDTETVMIFERGKCQVALKRDAEFYRSVFESISPEFYYKFLWKSSPCGVKRTQITPMFNALYRAAKSTKKEI
jgi:hypothetical protein